MQADVVDHMVSILYQTQAANSKYTKYKIFIKRLHPFLTRWCPRRQLRLKNRTVDRLHVQSKSVKQPAAYHLNSIFTRWSSCWSLTRRQPYTWSGSSVIEDAGKRSGKSRCEVRAVKRRREFGNRPGRRGSIINEVCWLSVKPESGPRS